MTLQIYSSSFKSPRLLQLLNQASLPVKVALAFLLIVVIAAIAPQFLATHDPFAIDPGGAFSSPSLHHWFGTDQSGRDTYSRVVYGASASLEVGLIAISIALAIGAVLGVGAVLGGNWADLAVSRLIDVFFAFPGLILALIIISLMGPSPFTVAIAVGIGNAAGYARIIRAQAMIVTRSDYVLAERALGHSSSRTLGFTILPNIARPLLPLFTLGVGQTVVWATALSFLGLGARPPSAEWGALLSDSRNYIAMAWWLTVFPGATIAATGLALTVLGRYLQSSLDGRPKT